MLSVVSSLTTGAGSLRVPVIFPNGEFSNDFVRSGPFVCVKLRLANGERLRQLCGYIDHLWSIAAVSGIDRDGCRLPVVSPSHERIFRGAKAGLLSWLLDRTNLLENLLHIFVALEADREAHGFAVEDDVDAWFAHTPSGFHGAEHFGYEFFHCEWLQGHHYTAWQVRLRQLLQFIMLEKQSNWNSIQVLLNGCIVYRRTEVWDSTSASDSLLLRSEISTGWPLLRRWHLRWVEELIMSELRCHLLAATCHDLRLNSHDLCFISNLPQRWKSFRGCILPLITLRVFLTVRWDLDSRWTAFFGLFCFDFCEFWDSVWKDNVDQINMAALNFLLAFFYAQLSLLAFCVAQYILCKKMQKCSTLRKDIVSCQEKEFPIIFEIVSSKLSFNYWLWEKPVK